MAFLARHVCNEIKDVRKIFKSLRIILKQVLKYSEQILKRLFKAQKNLRSGTTIGYLDRLMLEVSV